MSVLITLENAYLSYGGQPLLDQVNFHLQAGERVCLIGRNGAGKSSLLKILDGTVSLDSGKVLRIPGVKIARLEQDLPEALDMTIQEVMATAFLHTSFESWEVEKSIQDVLQKLALVPSQPLSSLSGGWRRRVLLAKALVVQPDLLLLDEPTNHLDIEAIQWLEDVLMQFRGGILFVTHDRSLLQRLATRIVELDRGHLTSFPGDYDNFLRRKEEFLLSEAHKNREFDKKLAEEERWIRQGIKARRTRNEGRVRALKAMREERKMRREVLGKSNFEMNEVHHSGDRVIEAHKLNYRVGDRVIVRDFSTCILRGERVGILGPNGVGKTTLIHLLLGKLKADQGEVKLGSKLDIAYFDQLRATLDPDKSILENVAGGRSSIMLHGKEKHIMTYLSDFLFPPQLVGVPVKTLSGGECNRVLLAKLFSQPANLLVMDEPTNDLDIETLELLEELLSQYSGTLLLVSHDRTFLDHSVTRTFVFEGEGKIGQYVGGYQDWLEQSKSSAFSAEKKEFAVKSKEKPIKATVNVKKTLVSLQVKIEKLEQDQQRLFAQMAAPGFYAGLAKEVNEVTEKLKNIEAEIEAAYAQWEALEKM